MYNKIGRAVWQCSHCFYRSDIIEYIQQHQRTCEA